MHYLRLILLSTCLTLLAAPSLATVCEAPDIGGTVALPPDCPGGYQGMLTIVDGLPPGTTLTGPAILTGFQGQGSLPGGSLGGEIHIFSGLLEWTVSGTGDMAGFSRFITIPVEGEMHTAPRIPGDPVQVFLNDMFSMTGALFGDPDFCDFYLTSGTAHGLPSPGSTTLTELPSGNFNVDSFFDITYRIDFTGCPGSILDGLAGSTTGTERYQAGEVYLPTIDHNCLLPDNGAGTIDLPPDCPDGYEGILTIVDGLPPGTELSGPAVLTDILVTSSGPGGTLGGEVQIFDATLYWEASGSGDLAGMVRNLAVPVSCEVHTGPRIPGDPVQVFGSNLISLNGALFGDPDFCELFITAGEANGLPSPGSTSITRVPSGDFAVDSFFDITYTIEFAGCPGSPLDGLTGTTAGTERFQAGEPYFEPIDHNCQLPDNGAGTVDLPPACPDGYEGTLTIVDGLPPGTEITGPAVLTDIVVIFQGPGGPLGGDFQVFDAVVYWEASGTGMLNGFQRNLAIPVNCTTHFGPRNPGEQVQDFPGEMNLMNGVIFGDPDFCDFSLVAGTGNGLPSPGSTTLTQLPTGDFAVDSFFDITYQIDFAGCPGSILDGMSGSTLATHSFQAGEPYHLSSIDGNGVPSLITLFQNQPNPFNPVTVISYELPTGGAHVAVDIFDIRGRHVRNLVNATQTGGFKSVTWNGTDTNGRRSASGVYFYTLKTGGQTLVRKMAIIK